MASRDLDIIVFGATGFTGRHTVPYVHKFCKTNGRSLTWGIAGRSEIKLKKLQAQFEKDLDIPANDIPIIIADTEDEESLKTMARKCRLIINCCGPYRFYGEPVVYACIMEGTHHIDVSGEPQYMETMQLRYHKEAEEKGIYVISACGFDSIPSEMGVIFLQQKFNGTLNSVETYMESGVDESGKNLPGSRINFGTWESAIYSIAHAKELRDIRSQLYPTRLPEFQPKLKLKKYPQKTADGWAVPFLGSDRSVVRRSQRYFYENDKQRPIQIETYMVIKSFLMLIISLLYGFIFATLSKFAHGRRLLLKYPEIFSAGYVSRLEPNEEKVQKTTFLIKLYGEGWKERLSEPTDEHTAPIDKVIIGQVKGPNPAYGSTCIALALCGIIVLTEPDKLPKKGGVYPPGAAFAKTTMLQQLNENGVTFEILSEKDLK